MDMTCSPCQCRLIVEKAVAAGAVAAGFVSVEPLSDVETSLHKRWIADGRHAGMTYMERYADLRANPATLLEGARSMLCTAFAYAPAKRHPLISDYALGQDYHEVLRQALQPVAKAMEETVARSATRICIDTAPLRERLWAARAGLGDIGLNNLLIVPGIGTRVFLAEILWTASIGKTDTPKATPQLCDGCGACVRACPYGALDGHGGLDARRCLSYLTIEHRGPLPDGVSLSGRRVYGCDICQDACPHNNTPRPTVLPSFEPLPEVMQLTLADMATIENSAFNRIFRHSAIRRTKAEGLRRNALNALGDDTTHN